MANGKVTSGTGSSMDKVVEIAMRAGKWGIAGLVCLMLQSTISFIADIGTWNSLREFGNDIASLLGTYGVGFSIIGLLANTKRGNDMTATIGAESKIDRAHIANALDGPATVLSAPTSADPAVQREIKKLNGGPH